MGMEARYVTRKQPWLEACQVAPAIVDQVMPRVATFLAPFVAPFCRQAPDQHAHTSVWGLRADVARQHVAAIAERGGHDRLPLQRVIGWARWEDAPWRQEVTRQVAEPWGHADGVLGCAPAGCPTSGPASGGVARQWWGRLGQVDHGHVAVAMGDVSGAGHPLVDMRLSLPHAWTTAKARLANAGVPATPRGSRSRPQLALARVPARGPQLPQGWSAGEDAMGRP